MGFLREGFIADDFTQKAWCEGRVFGFPLVSLAGNCSLPVYFLINRINSITLGFLERCCEKKVRVRVFQRCSFVEDKF